LEEENSTVKHLKKNLFTFVTNLSYHNEFCISLYSHLVKVWLQWLSHSYEEEKIASCFGILPIRHLQFTHL